MSGTDAFIMKADGKGWLYVPTGLVDGPLPDPLRAGRVAGARTRSTSSSRARCSSTGSTTATPLAAVGDPKFPYVITTYRLTEHYLSAR